MLPNISAMRNTQADLQKAPFTNIAFSHGVVLSEWPLVFSLPALGALRHIDGVTLLKAFETARLDSRKMHKNVCATLTTNEAVALGVVEPLHCSLFCHVDAGVPFNRFTLERFGSTEGRLQACGARAAHDRFGLTYSSS